MAYASSLKNAETSTTFLDDYIDGLAAMPNEIRRHFELMRSLDKEADTVWKAF
jgi:hypothetical protein